MGRNDENSWLENNMKCWHCGNDLIWGGDHTYEDYGLDGDGIVSNLSCSKCPAEVLVYLPDEELIPDIDDSPDIKERRYK